MFKREFLEIIANGKNSVVGFKRDDVRPEQLAKEILTFANSNLGKHRLSTEDYCERTLVHYKPQNEPNDPKHDPKTQDIDPRNTHLDRINDPKTSILTLITEKPSITYAELAGSLNKSPATVKRYLKELEASGVVSRSRGKKVESG